ncbi:hypothetical protein [Tenacibaculum xiamenense]|uniref:hypothetical protein n=1 Tax=Tenacibaculum xiamenense TaxID=1261553 RepID=UPI003894C1A7
MAIYGVGAYYDTDVSEDFINQNLVGVGWSATEAPELQEYFKSLKVGDIVYIKAAPIGQDIYVKGIGVIEDNSIVSNPLVTTGRKVKWIDTSKFTISRPKEKNNVRSNTIYEEFHPDVLKEIIKRIN